MSHRRFSTGFYFGKPDQYTENGGYIRDWDIAGVVTGWENGELLLTQKNKFWEGDMLEVLAPGERPCPLTAEGMRDEAGTPLSAASHPEMKLSLRCERFFPAGSILRKPSGDRWSAERQTN